MSHRNIPGTNQTIEYQLHGPLPHGPGVFGGSMRNSFQQNAHVTLPVPIIEGHHLPEQYNNSIPYGIPPYGAIVHHPAPNCVSAAPNFYSPYMNHCNFSAPLAYGPYDHMPYHGVVGNSFIYGLPSKVKNAEIHGYVQNSNASTSSGSAADSLNIRHMEPGPAVTGSEQFPHGHFIMNPVPSLMEVASRINVADRPGAPVPDSVMMPGPMYSVPGSYLGQPFLPAGYVWSDQTHSVNQVDVGIRPWSRLPAAPILPGGNASRSASGAMNVQGYQDMASNVQGYQDMASNSSANFLPHISHGGIPQALPPPPPIVVGTHNANFYQVAGPSYRVPANSPLHGPLNLPQEGLNSGLRLQGTVLPTGIRIYRPQRGTLPDATVRSQSTPYLRVMHREEVAELVIPDDYEEISVDQHRDMRMDIEHMSYEELLALGDRIGNVSTGLTVKDIRKHLKTKVHVARSASTSREKYAFEDHDFDSCIICQSDFEDNEKIGILSCKHEYHAGCLEKWLLVKNVCPVCKSSALVIEEKSKV